MANVIITDTMRLMVKRNICKPFNERYLAANTMSVADSLMFYERFMVTPEQTALLKQVPSAWLTLSHTDSQNHKIHIAHSDVDRHWLELRMPAGMPFYYVYQWTYGPHSDVTYTERTNSSWFKFDLRTLETETPYFDNLKAICAERDAMVATVEKILKGCKTLNQAQRVWPAITKYVNADVMERMNRKVMRKTAESLNLDPEAMQALSVHHIRQQMIA